MTNPSIEAFAGNTGEGREDSKNTIVTGKTTNGESTKSIAIADAPDGGTSLKDITPRRNAEIENFRRETENLNNNLVGGRKNPTSASNDESLPGMRSIDALQDVNNSSISQTPENVETNRLPSEVCSTSNRGRNIRMTWQPGDTRIIS